jgi:hypothetical protein
LRGEERIVDEADIAAPIACLPAPTCSTCWCGWAWLHNGDVAAFLAIDAKTISPDIKGE